MLRELPAHPHLADGLELIEGPGDFLQLRGCTPPLRLTGRMVHRLLPLLDGAHSLDAITTALDEWPPAEVLKAVGLLCERGLICDGAPVPVPAESRSQAAFYWSASAGPAERGELAKQALSDARLHLYGWGALVQELERNLRTCGCEALTVERWAPPPGLDGALAAGAPFPTPAAFEQGVLAGDLVLLALPRPAPALLEAANRGCLSQGVPLLPVVINQGEAVIGPTVLPGRSACYHCFKERLKSNASFPDDDGAYEAHLDGVVAGVTLPEWPPFTAAVAALAAMEAVRLVTQFTPPVTLGQALFIEASSGRQHTSRVWKLPRCPVCMRVRPAESGGERDG